MRALLRIALSALSLAAGAAAAAPGADASWTLHLPEGAKVPFRGVASFDAAGGPAAPILYPAPGLAGFVAAVITHGVMVESTKAAERERIQEKADEILAPFRAVIDAYTPEELVRAGIPRMATAGPKRLATGASERGAGWRVRSAPQFAMTQDRRAILVDNAVVVDRGADADPPAYSNVVRVVSSPLPPGRDPEAAWGEAGGRHLKETSARLWAESIDAALGQLAGSPAEAPSKTVRYWEGGVERMERAQVLVERCDRAFIRTLRGELMSVPLARVPAGCSAGTQAPR